MKRRLMGLLIFLALTSVGCDHAQTPSNGGAAIVQGSPSAAVTATAAPEVVNQTPIRPVLPEPPQGDLAASCFALVRVKRYDVALQPCLLALEANPTNERLVEAVKEIQSAVVNAAAPTGAPAP